MAQRNVEKNRKCRKCEKLISNVTAQGIKDHEQTCGGKS